MHIMHWAPLMTCSPINCFLLIVHCSLCPIYCTQFNSCSELLTLLELLPQYTSIQELNTSQTLIFTNEIRDITLLLLLAMKHTETLRSKVLTNFEYLVGDSYDVIFQCKQHNTDFIKFKMHFLLQRLLCALSQMKLQCFKSSIQRTNTK